MKLLRFGPLGAEKPGLLDDQGQIRDLSGVVPDIGGDVLSPEGLTRLAQVNVQDLPHVDAGVRIGSCIARPGNFIAVGLNYSDHAKESNLPIPKEPILFNKAPSSLSGPDDDVPLPDDAPRTDWEVELAFVMGRDAYRIAEADALDAVAGYCICNDISERGWQLDTGGQWMKGKSGPAFSPLGPWLVTADELGDPQSLGMKLGLNGETMQTGSTNTMIFSIAELVAYISRFMKLERGDLITTGTPPGIGMARKPPHYLKVGDVMDLKISGLGVQRQNVTRFLD